MYVELAKRLSLIPYTVLVYNVLLKLVIMFSTSIGPFDGDGWESLMQICFRMKYEKNHYQQIPASPGDYGIEGFTSCGKVFQCYCPDYDMMSKDLYEKQRQKITDDLKKLKTYEQDLKKLLNGVQIKEWIFVTPEYRMKELIEHCNNKAKEVIQTNMSIIAPDFRIVIHDINNFSNEIPIALNGEGKKMLIKGSDSLPVAVTKWKDQEISLVENAVRKHTKRFPVDSSKLEEKVNTLTESTIRDFLNGESILRKWQQLHPENYDKFLILFGELEKEVSEKCMFPTTDNNVMYDSLKEMVYTRIKTSFFSYLDDITIIQLTNRCIAYWLVRCPLDFE